MGDLIMVQPHAAEDKIGTLWLPETAKEKPQTCTVIQLGNGKLERDAKGEWFTHPHRVKVGDKLIISKYGGTEVNVDGKTYKLVHADDIMAICVE